MAKESIEGVLGMLQGAFADSEQLKALLQMLANAAMAVQLGGGGVAGDVRGDSGAVVSKLSPAGNS